MLRKVQQNTNLEERVFWIRWKKCCYLENCYENVENVIENVENCIKVENVIEKVQNVIEKVENVIENRKFY